MISKTYQQDVFITDFTEYYKTTGEKKSGVIVDISENGILPSFVLKNRNRVVFSVINNEENANIFTLEDGTKVSNCECIVRTDRHDNRKGWMLFLELKYCQPKNVHSNMLVGIGQLKATCDYVLKEKHLFDSSRYKIYLVISTPNALPLDPFDASYFDQDYMLTIKENTGAVLKASNVAIIQTPSVVDFE